ncbi:MAG: chorismate synthase [Candidatus Aminicenantia bacterium]
MFRYLTAGESHGKSLIGILEGMVAGLRVNIERIEKELRLRRIPYGRSQRMELEKEEVEILSGIRNGITTGAPITVIISNQDVKELENFTPRPGHADLAGCIKYGFYNIHLIAERASARETAVRVALGAIAKLFLSNFGIDFTSHTVRIGEVKCEKKYPFEFIKDNREASSIFCLEKEKEILMLKAIDEAQNTGDTIGGETEIIVKGIPAGLGSHVHYDRRLDFRVGGALLSIPGVKGIEIGEAHTLGSKNYDQIIIRKGRIEREGNHSGGIEGGISNGENMIIRLKIKPPPTLRMDIPSIDLKKKKLSVAPKFRGDTCVVPSAGIVAENVLALEITNLFLEKFGGDSLEEVMENWKNYLKRVSNFLSLEND